MSGIVALLNLNGAPVDRALLLRMTEHLTFRGPDAQRAQTCGNVGFGHTLLDLDDPSSRPETPFAMDGGAWVVADARLDARDDLIAELRSHAQDDVVEDASDGELIARAYRAWGDDCVAHLIGDFAFVVWDARAQRLVCARDHLGVKPLFFAQRGSAVVVSNTLDCIRLHPAVSRELHDPAIADFLLFGVNQDSGATSFRDISRVPPAHVITWTPDAEGRQRYWTLPIDEPIHYKRADEYTDRFRELLRVALRDRLRSRRAGVLMSGGLDSPTLAAAALDVLREKPDDFLLQGITSVYDRLVPDSERRYAALVAEHLHLPIRYDVRDDETSLSHWDDVRVHTPEPVDNPPAFAAGVEFFRRMTSDVRVFLYGEGPDNALGYEWRPYLGHLAARGRVARLVRALTSDLYLHPRVPLWSSVRQIAGSIASAPAAEDIPPWINDTFAASCRERRNAVSRTAASQHPFRPRGYAGFSDVRWQSLFEDCDITAALSHADVRHPFLDLRLLRYMLALPAMPWCRNKLIIRRAMRSSLPGTVLRRPKTSLGASPDFERVRRSGLPRMVPSPDLLKYVIPDRIPASPRDPLELRSALRPLGLNAWLHNLGSH